MGKFIYTACDCWYSRLYYPLPINGDIHAFATRVRSELRTMCTSSLSQCRTPCRAGLIFFRGNPNTGKNVRVATWRGLPGFHMSSHMVMYLSFHTSTDSILIPDPPTNRHGDCILNVSSSITVRNIECGRACKACRLHLANQFQPGIYANFLNARLFSFSFVQQGERLTWSKEREILSFMAF